jgi:PncC family amidohydrolase
MPANVHEIALQLHQTLCSRTLTLAIAESCTGGALSSHLTRQSGASKYFLGGIIAYANSAKQHILHVDPHLLCSHGAVSRAVAIQMAEETRLLFGTDYSAAVTGIAGPTGGTPDKPIGTVWATLSSYHAPPQAWLMFLNGNRDEIIDKSCFYVLNRLLQAITE